MSLVKFAHNKDAVSFKKALIEKIEEKVGNILTETKISLASTILNENPNGITSSDGGVSSMEAGGEVGKDRVSDEIKSAPGIKNFDTKISGVTKKPDPSGKGGKSVSGDNSTFTAVLPGQNESIEEETRELNPEHHAALKRYAAANGRSWKSKLNTDWEKGHTHGDDTANIRQVRNLIGPSGLSKYKLQNEEVEKKEPSDKHSMSKGKRAIRFALKKKYDKRQNEEVQIDEKIITPGSTEHMAHAVHGVASGHGEHSHTATRGTFHSYTTPHYTIHRDASIHAASSSEHKEPEKYYVTGHDGMHKFHVSHTKKGIDVKHAGKVS